MNTSIFQVTYDRDWTWIQFTSKPAESILAALREFAHFSKRRTAWYATERIAETEIASRLAVTPASELVIEVTPAPETASAPAPVRKPAKARAPQAQANQSAAARAWLAGLDLNAITEDNHAVAEFYKCDVAVCRLSSGLCLYTRTPQQKQNRWASTTRAYKAQTLDELQEGLERFITEQEAKQERRNALTAAKRAARESFVNPYHVGEFLYSSWGYDQTNREFYQILEVRPCALKICEVYQKDHGATGPDSWLCSPRPNEFKGEARWVTIQIDANGRHGIPSPIHGGLYLWDGKPLYASDGH